MSRITKKNQTVEAVTVGKVGSVSGLTAEEAPPEVLFLKADKIEADNESGAEKADTAEASGQEKVRTSDLATVPCACAATVADNCVESKNINDNGEATAVSCEEGDLQNLGAMIFKNPTEQKKSPRKKLHIEQALLIMSLLKWTFLAAFSGLFVGLVCSGFLFLLHLAIDFSTQWDLYFVLLPLGMFLSALIIKYLAPDAEGHGTEKAIEAIHKKSGRVKLAAT